MDGIADLVMRYTRSSSSARGYGSRWQTARATFLRSHPLCVECAKQGKVTAAIVVDHITPHRGDQTLFWDEANWQSLCKPHHDRDKQIIESRGYTSDVGPDGLPLDPNHPFYGRST